MRAAGRLASVLPDAAVVCDELWLDQPIPPPLPAEARQVERAVPRRRTEYAAGRYLARRALGALGVADFALIDGPDRAPVWPTGITGTITHTGAAPNGYCAVAVAPTDEVQAVGLDAELATPLDPELWPSVLRPEEREQVAALPAPSQGLFAKALFSAKESAYKAQYTVTRQFLGFHDVRIDLSGDRFGVAFVNQAGTPRLEEIGRIRVDDKLILTGVILKRRDAALLTRGAT